MQKIVQNHSTNCPGLMKVLTQFVNNNYLDVKKINPGRISRTKQSSENFDLRVSQHLDNGSYKCIARSGTFAQDVFILISPTSKIKSGSDLSEKINSSLPKRARRTKVYQQNRKTNKRYSSTKKLRDDSLESVVEYLVRMSH